MQNAPAPLAQRMMSRQAPYGPVGMVSQNMSGNKKGAGGGSTPTGVIGLKFDTATATAGLTFSNSDTTATAPTAGVKSAKANASTIPNTGNYWYWEFTVSGHLNQFIGFGLSSFVCNTTNQVGAIANSVCYNANGGQVYAANNLMGTYATAALGDIIGFKLEVFNPGALITVIKNGVVIANQIDVSLYISGFTQSWTPIFTANQSGPSATISNNVYSYAGFTPIGTVTTIAASASVPAVADGAYDVYTFNASGTFTAGSTGAVRALVIAGGGGGGEYCAGGAGGYLENGSVVTPQTYTVTVGAGAIGYTRGNASTFNAISTVGGGSQNLTGGSGGGGNPVTPGGANTQPGQAGTAGQGFAGGSGSTNSVDAGGGAGGGAGGVGGNGNGGGSGGTGGIGAFSNITGTSIGRAGGGGGYGTQAQGGATSGGGGGLGNGTANTGGGGGGANRIGGSGVVIIRVRARA